MNKAELVFKAIDVVCYQSQNTERFKDIHCVKDIAYGSNPKERGNLYYRKDILNDGELHPVVVYYHGGGFIMGDKDYRVSISEFYADKGYFVYDLNYRMPPEVCYPEITYDWVWGLNSLVPLSEKYNIDLDNIFVTGDSSGAYTASFIPSIKYNDDLREKINCPKIEVELKGALLMCGIYDIEVLLGGTKLFGVLPETGRMLLGYDLKDDYSNLKDYKWLDCLSSSNFINDKWCSTFICWSNSDFICQNQGKPMAEKIAPLVPYFDSYDVDGFFNNHCFHLLFHSNKYAKECMDKTVNFIERVRKMPSKKKELVTVGAAEEKAEAPKKRSGKKTPPKKSTKKKEPATV